MTNDAELIQRLLKDTDDQEAYHLIFQKYYEKVFRYTLKFLRNYEDAEEIANDTFSRAFRKMENLRDPAKLLRWLYTIARNLALNRQRDEDRRLAGTELLVYEESSVEEQTMLLTGDIAAINAYRAFGQSQVNSEREVVLRRLIHLLPEKDRQIMQYYYFYDWRQKKIAALMNTTFKSVEHRLARTRNLLKAIVSQLDDLLSLLSSEESMMMGRYLLDRFSHEEIAELVGSVYIV
ncbi:MAG: sigma-70 family RNA polymerase sigma factor [Candidatus Poribacteria bacterium]|nr:sigma-70 family RNA polymerase sigma factor [Candidatus Poribacteria bacterium]